MKRQEMSLERGRHIFLCFFHLLLVERQLFWLQAEQAFFYEKEKNNRLCAEEGGTREKLPGSPKLWKIKPALIIFGLRLCERKINFYLF